MANFDDLTVSGLCRANQVNAGIQANGLVPTGPGEAAATLVEGGNNVNWALPQLGFQGAMFFALTSNGAGAVLTGIDSTNARAGMMIILKNNNALGGDTIATSANGASSAVGNRFSRAVTLNPGEIQWFLYDGTYWCPAA